MKLHLSAFTQLREEDEKLIERACTRQVRRLSARQDIIHEGEKPHAVNVLLDGWAMRYKQLADGRRQILSFFLPGDLCDANIFILKQMDHSVGALTAISFAEITRPDFEDLMEASTRITRALWWSSLVSAAIQREWTMSVGQRSAYERIGHLFCELYLRLRMVGRVDGHSFVFPLTQTDIADATGMTPVHVNRTLQQLRRDGLIELENKYLTLPHPAQLMDASQFNPNYLHLGGGEER